MCIHAFRINISYYICHYSVLIPLRITKKCLTLVSIHYCVSFGHLKKTHFCPRVTKQEFLTLYRKDCRVKKISIESTLYFLYSKRFCSAINTSNFGVNIKLLHFIGVFRHFTCYFLNNYKLYKFSFMTRNFLKHPRTPYSAFFFKYTMLQSF